MREELRLVASLPGHHEAAWSVAWNPRESLLASCSTDRDVRLFSYAELPSGVSGEVLPAFSLKEVIPTGHKRTVRSVGWHPSGKMFATASFDATVGIWERMPDDAAAEHDGEPAWECAGTLEGHDSECKSVVFSSNGQLLASCSRDKSVWVWEVQPDSDFECLSVMIEHTQDVKSLAWHPREEVRAKNSRSFWRPRRTMTRSSCMLMTRPRTGSAMPRSRATSLRCGR